MTLDEYKCKPAAKVAEALNKELITPLSFRDEDKLIAALINALNRIDALEKQILITADDV